MGNDWNFFEYSADGSRVIVDSLMGCCSGNFSDIWKKYDFDRDQLHGHSGRVVIHYLNTVIDKMLANGVEPLQKNEIEYYSGKNRNFWWGVGESDTIRIRIVLHRLMLYRTYAEKHYQAYWFGDQTYYKGPYTIDGVEYVGKPDDSYWYEKEEEDY